MLKYLHLISSHEYSGDIKVKKKEVGTDDRQTFRQSIILFWVKLERSTDDQKSNTPSKMDSESALVFGLCLAERYQELMRFFTS